MPPSGIALHPLEGHAPLFEKCCIKVTLNFLVDGAVDSIAKTENMHNKDIDPEKNEENNLNDVKKEDEIDVGEFDDIFSDSSESDNESLGQRLVIHL